MYGIIKIEREGRAMTEIRFSYNPFTKDFIESTVCHAIAIANKGKTKSFDEYIRGIIIDDVLYLRTYFPFPISHGISVIELRQKSRELLESFRAEILGVLSYQYKYVTTDIVYNAENDLLEGIGLANI